MSNVRKDGSTGGGHKPWHTIAAQEADAREPFVAREVEEGSGFRVRISPKSGWAIVELDIAADPRKDAKWASEMKALIGETRWRREFMRDWTLSTQSPFYPEYLARGGDETFCRSITELGRGPIYAGLDFGVRRPALLACQANPSKTRLYCLREWMPAGVQATPFLEVCEWLLGELPRKQLSPEALVHVLELERKAQEGRGPAVPWFQDPPQVIRVTSHEALRTSQEVAQESRERRLVDIWEARGFPLQVHFAQVRGGSDVVRHLLRTPPKGVLPYLVVDPWCKVLKEGLGGGYTFKRATRENPMPDEPVKDGYYEHLQDDLRYIASQAIDMKAIDPGTPDTQSSESITVAPKVEKKADKSVYSREQADDDGDAFSSPFGTPRNERAYYERGE